MSRFNKTDVKVINKYGEERFKQENPCSFILLKLGPGETSSPIYNVLSYVVENNIGVYNEDVIHSAERSRNYQMGSTGHQLAIAAWELDNIIVNGGLAKRRFDQLWSAIYAYSSESLGLYREAMQYIGQECNLEKEYVNETIGLSTNLSDEDASDEEE